MILSHISDRADIERFEPRPAPSASSGQEGLMVWAVDDSHLHNYLLPRECPRVCFRVGEKTSDRDRARWMVSPSVHAVVTIESRWFARLRNEKLYRYILPSAPFTCIDAGAGYYIARETVVPERVEVIDDLPLALVERNVELRITPCLWPLRDAVVDSTLEFSIIRMRNAQPPHNGYQPRHGM